MYWQAEIETLDHVKLKELQLELLNKTLQQINQSHFYKLLFKSKQIEKKKIEKIQDIREFPFTAITDLASYNPYNFLAIDRKEVVRVNTNVGAHGLKKFAFYSKNDIEKCINAGARSLFTANIKNTDVFQNICNYNSKNEGIGYQLAAERIGAMVIGSGKVSWQKQIQLMRDYGTTAIYTYSSNIQPFLNTCYDLNIDPRFDLELRTIIIDNSYNKFISNKNIETKLSLNCYTSYGIEQLFNPGIAIECEAKNGMHIWEDYFFVEIIDPITLEPVPAGEFGELVVTTLQHEAMPLLRFRTGDITRFITSPCSCGRNHIKIDYISKRTDDQFYIFGQLIQPLQIEEVLKNIPEVGENYLIYLDNSEGTDEMIIEIEVLDELYLDNYGKLEKLSRYLIQNIENEIQVKPHIRLVQPNYFNQNTELAKKVIDKRQPLK